MMPGFYKLLALLGVLLPARHVQLETHGTSDYFVQGR